MTLRRGISLIEVTISMVIVSILSMGVIQMLGIAAQTRAMSSDRIRGQHLANQLLAEIQSKAWHDPIGGPASFGPGGSEYDGKTRLLYNDLDDYEGWTQSPPLEPNGDEIVGFQGWERSVDIQYALISGGSVTTSGTFERAKLITVTVKRNGRTIASVSAIRTLGFEEVADEDLPASGTTDFVADLGDGEDD
ncbi:MAG: prepilin-type N-terminal cleavage/methylation domain-containing protein [Phycisphaerales bacterium JB050]